LAVFLVFLAIFCLVSRRFTTLATRQFLMDVKNFPSYLRQIKSGKQKIATVVYGLLWWVWWRHESCHFVVGITNCYLFTHSKPRPAL